ncbi:MAG: 2OG-Fe(II) oxygenase [Gammaproteobacteria bacterium]|nr:2OG-Fe(II) oxygenase [Gammaproteobacteria bacterium]
MTNKSMTKKEFDDDWKIWIWSNVGRGCAKEGIFKILIDNGFDYDSIKNELDFEPSVDLDQIVIPQTNQSLPPNRFFVANSRRIDNDHVELYTLENFLTEDECHYLIDLMQSDLRQSTVTNEDEVEKDFRTSKTFDFNKINDPVADAIDIRICRTLGINPSYSEEIQGQIYDTGEEFKAHTDWFTPGTKEYIEHASTRGQRSWTFMIYLNDVESGGETSFVEIGETIQPKAGSAVFWNNLYPHGQPNQNTMHHALPVKAGFKAVITKWFRVNGTGEMNWKTEAELLPNFTRIGFEKSKMPVETYQLLKSFLDENRQRAEKEYQSLDYLANDSTHPTVMVELPVQLKQLASESIKPIVEKWSGVEVVSTSIYGIRCYHQGTTLGPHRDTTETHILSAIININQEVTNDWPLEIEDNYYCSHEVFLQPGEMLLYESARLLHGRITPLQGDCYCNLFIHFMPASDDWKESAWAKLHCSE